MDPIADTLIQIKNAGLAGKETTTLPYSKFRHAVVSALLKAGYVAFVDRKIRKQKKVLEVGIVYENAKPRIHDVKKLSKLSRRLYAASKNLRSVRQGYGDIFLSTHQGIFTAKEAKEKNIGGEILFEIW